MTWNRVDDQVHNNEELIGVGPLPGWLYFHSTSYSRDRTRPGWHKDWHITEAGARQLAGKLGVPRSAIKALVAAGWWEQLEDGCLYIHHEGICPDPNPEISAKRAAAGRAGGFAKAQANGSVTPVDIDTTPGNPLAICQDDASDLPPDPGKSLAKGNPNIPRFHRNLDNNSETPVTSEAPGDREKSESDPGDPGPEPTVERDLRRASKAEREQLERLMDWWGPKVPTPLTGQTRHAELTSGLAIIRLRIAEQDRLNEIHRVWSEHDGRDATGRPIESLAYFWQALERLEHARIQTGLAAPTALGSVLRRVAQSASTEVH